MTTVPTATLVDEDAETTAAHVLRFSAGLPGFPAAHAFQLVPWGGTGSPFALLESLDEPDLAFVVVPPAVFFPDYEPELDDASVERLGLRSAADALVLVIVTLGATAADATANLLGPIVVNTATDEALQAVLAGQPWTSRTPLKR